MLMILTLDTTYMWSTSNILKQKCLQSFITEHPRYVTRLLGLELLDIWIFSNLFQVQFSFCFCFLETINFTEKKKKQKNESKMTK